MAGFTRKMILVCVLALLASPMQSALAAEPNKIEIDVFENAVYLQEVILPMGGTESLHMTGQVTVHVFFEGLQEGLADDDDGDSLDEVATEMVELDLVGLSPILGLVRMRLRTGLQSIGEMEEITDSNTGLLDVPPFGSGTVGSFFNVFFELEIGGQRFYNIAPLRWQGVLSEKPAGHQDTYVNLEDIQLFDENGLPTQFFLGAGRLRPNPSVEIDVFETPICMLDLIMPDGSTVTIPMVGDSTEHVFFEGAVEGSAFDDDGNLRDDVQTEMVELNLRGYHSVLGPVNMRLNTDLPSTGQMEERTDYNTGVLDVPPFFKDGMVESFFDIYFEIELPALAWTLHNNDPMRWQGVLWHKPADPLTVYENLQDVQLFDEAGNPINIFVTASKYRPNPVVEVDYMDTSIGAVDLITPTGQYTIELAGSSAMNVFFERDFEGSASDDDRNGLDEVVTEIIALQLSGSNPEIGEVILRSDPCALSLGRIEEMDDIKTGRLDLPPFSDTGDSAESFFDITFEIEFAERKFYGEEPMRLHGVLNHKPAAPGDIYENSEDIRLVDADGMDTGCFIVTARYQPIACGDALHPYPIGDLNFDCAVNLKDVAIIGLHWLECTRPICP